MPPRSFDHGTLEQVMSMLHKPRTFEYLQRQLGVDRSTVYVWLKRAHDAQSTIEVITRRINGVVHYQLINSWRLR
jgi:transposase-like protein